MLISHAKLTYQHKIIFDNLSLPFHENQWTCILGKSGTGKSSLLRMIAHLPIDGKVNFETKNLQQKISYMTQTESLLPWLNIRDNILITCKLSNKKITDNDIKHAAFLLEELDLVEYVHSKPAQLSGGQRQRAGLARTLFENRKIVLMDEPFSALDTMTKLKLYSLFKKMLSNKTVIFVTHDPIEALRLADHIYILSGNPAQLTSLTKNQLKEIHANQFIQDYDNIVAKLIYEQTSI